MNESKKWKSRLLSSSLPLEYEVAKILTDLDFSISFDYTYYRKDGEHKKEFSTDLRGYTSFPLDNENEIDADLTLIAECKYREEGKKWIFLPDINKPEFSIFTFGHTIKSLAEFSTYKNKQNPIVSFEEKLEFALKGVEVNLTTGEVFDKDIRHGISQLKFALPYLIKDSIEGNIYGHLVDAKPSYLLSILITNSELYIFNNDFSIDKIKKVEKIEDLAKKVPYLICHSEIGPDFIDHHKDIFEDFNSNAEQPNMKKFEAFQKTTKDKKYGIYNSPIRTCSDLEFSFPYTLKEYYSQHFICSFEHFPELINLILKILSKATKRKR
jgi:hypothetical protein